MEPERNMKWMETEELNNEETFMDCLLYTSRADIRGDAGIFAASGPGGRLWADVREPRGPHHCEGVHIGHARHAADAAADGLSLIHICFPV